MRSSASRITILLAGLAALLLAVVGCAPLRSVEAYCDTMAKHRASYLGQMDLGGEVGLEDVLGAASAIGDLKVMWTELAEVAPEAIRVDSESVRDAWIAQEEAALKGDLFGAFGTGLLSAGAMTRVDAFVRDNCTF